MTTTHPGGTVKARSPICAGPLIAAAVLACVLLSPSGAAAATCANEALREAQGATGLPGCMALEMVSPPKKLLQRAFSPSFSLDGGRVLFRSKAALADTPGFQSFNGDRYVATRTAGGWDTASTSPPIGEIVSGGRNFGGPNIFTPDLSRWATLGSTQSQAQVGHSQLFSGGLDGSFAPLSPLMMSIDNSGSDQLQFFVSFLDVNGASDDLSSVVLRISQTPFVTSFLPGDPNGGTQGVEAGNGRNSYVAFLDEGVPSLQLLARDKDGVVFGGRCGASLGAAFNEGARPTLNQGAISADGSRIYLSTRPAQPFDEEEGEGPPCTTANPLRILERTVTGAGPEITPLLPGGPSEWEEAGDDIYEGASQDGSKVYFTTPRSLAPSDTDAGVGTCAATLDLSDGCDLYLYDSAEPEGERLTHVSAAEGGGAADVLSSITAIDRAGAGAYFTAQGVLTADPNPEGATAQAGQPNLYRYDAQAGQTTFVGVLAEGDEGAMWGANGTYFSDAYATSGVLVFASKAPLTADDGDVARRDVFRYDAAAATLERISRAAAGGSDNGAFDVVVNPRHNTKAVESNFGEQMRWVSDGGNTIAFATAEPLVPGDEDGVANPYVWREGELGAVEAPVDVPPASAPDGAQIAFSTRLALLPQDRDTAEDVYVAREGGGFPLPPPPTQCDPLQEGSCQKAMALPQAPGAPATSGFSGPGNVRESSRCRRPLVKRRGRCVKRQRRGKSTPRAGRRGGGRR